MKRSIFVYLFSTITVIMYAQNTLLLEPDPNLTDSTSLIPNRKVEIVSDGIIVTYTFHSIEITKDPIYENAYSVNIEGFGHNMSASEPSTPNRWDSFLIPSSTSYTMSVIDSSYIDYPLELSPARPLVWGSSIETYSKKDIKPILPYDGFFPKTFISSSFIQEYRGKNILKIGLTPLKYNYNQKVIRILKSISYKITFTKQNTNVTSMLKYNSNYSILSRSVLNAMSMNEEIQHTNATNLTRDYLIITVPAYEEAALKLADWKRTLGYKVIIKSRQLWDEDCVKDSVLSTYNHSNSLYYLLIIGDHEDIPAKECEYNHNSFYSDYDYGCMGGESDDLSDLFVGRLSVSNPSEANIVVQKIIDYEKKPSNDTSYYHSGLNCAYFESEDGYQEEGKFTHTCETIKKYLENYNNKTINRVYYTESTVSPLYWENGEEIPYELQKPQYAWNGNYIDIQNAINTGTLYVLHRGHGNHQVWGKPYLNISHLSALNNTNKLPVVFSMNCETGSFTQTGVCFAEAFLRKQNGGCVAIFAATDVVRAGGYSDALTYGMFNAIWPNPGLVSNLSPSYQQDPVYQLGEILSLGCETVGEEYPNIDYGQHVRKLFHCFGDPSMEIYSEAPTEFSHVDIVRNGSGISVSTDEIGYISFYDRSTKNVVSYYGLSANIITSNMNMIVSVKNHNKIPYVDDPSDCLYIQNESISGNHDYNYPYVKIGSHVTDENSPGRVVFNNGHIRIHARSVEIQGETDIKLGTQFEIGE